MLDTESGPEQVPGDELAGSASPLVSHTSYYHWGNRSDWNAPQFEHCSPALVQLLGYLQAHWGGTYLGCEGDRTVKNGSSTNMSSHAWGAALDYNSGSWSTNYGPIASFLIAHSQELGINTIHDYRFVNGRGRMWKPNLGWVPANIGGPGIWMHIEVRPDAYFDGRSVDEKLGAAAAPAPPSPAAALGMPADFDFTFDATFYLQANPDVAAAYGAANTQGALQHWLQFGLREGRQGSAMFNGNFYLATHPDVAAWSGDRAGIGAGIHYDTWGVDEGRAGAPNFDVRYYLATYPDLAVALGGSTRVAAFHYARYGLAEGRRASPAFDPRFYLQANPDVAQVFGAENYRSALLHWLTFGRAEGRRGAP
ncbi:MAG: hypothetical protein IPJ65_41895 [Archangiaceae bacterium]|nr:hypothetical protein [Archangiaceae bacterium]